MAGGFIELVKKLVTTSILFFSLTMECLLVDVSLCLGVFSVLVCILLLIYFLRLLILNDTISWFMTIRYTKDDREKNLGLRRRRRLRDYRID